MSSYVNLKLRNSNYPDNLSEVVGYEVGIDDFYNIYHLSLEDQFKMTSVLIGRYQYKLSFSVIGRILGISSNRANQIHDKAIEVLRQYHISVNHINNVTDETFNIYNIDMSYHARQCLRWYHINDIRDIFDYSDYDLSRIRHVGKVTLQELIMIRDKYKEVAKA